MQKIENPSTSPVELSNEYGEMGKLLMAAEYLDAAEPCYLNAQALAPSEMRWPYYLGHLYKTKGVPAKSAALFEQVLQLRPDDEATLVWLGEVYLAQGRPEAAEPLLVKALLLQPRSVAAQFGLGRAALARKDYRRSAQQLEEALALKPQARGIHYPLAMAYRGLGEAEKAEAHLRQRADVDILPTDPLMQELRELVQSSGAYELRGDRDLNGGDWTAAIANFRKGIELEPDNPSVRHKLGTALFVAGDRRGAEEQFQEVVRRSPGFAKARYSLGVLMESTGRRQKAIEELSAAVKYDPTYAEARLRLAELLLLSGRPQEALFHYEDVAKVDSRIVEAPFGYAMALVRLRRYREARDQLIEGMRTYPNQPAFAHSLARLLAAAPDDRVRDGRRAMTLMRELLKGPQSIELGETMAMTLAELGQYDEAAAWQRDATAAAQRAGRADVARPMAENLRLYERRQPCRTPWRDDEPISIPGR
jgi:tetratricopeptide (TPR) repeat protein